MSRNINQTPQNSVVLNTHVANINKNGDIHLAVPSAARERVIKRAFPNLPRNFQSSSLFCRMERGSYRDRTSSGRRYTENPSAATCTECIAKAAEWNYGDLATISDSGDSSRFRLSKNSVHNIINWIPDSCRIVVSSKSIKVIDSVTNEEIEVKNIDRAAVVVAEKCFKEFSSEEAVSNKNIFSKKIFDFSNNQYVVQGLNINDKKKKFDGFILKSSKGNNLINLTFAQLFNQGYHFEDGTPCGEYTDNRQPLVSSEIEEDGIGIGIDVMM